MLERNLNWLPFEEDFDIIIELECLVAYQAFDVGNL